MPSTRMAMRDDVSVEDDAASGRRTPLLEVDDVRVAYPQRGFRRPDMEILHGVDLTVRPGETMGLVGESGSGKTTLGRAILGLTPVASGAVRFGGVDITRMPCRTRVARDIGVQAVFQDPYRSLNPSLRVGDLLAEPLRAKGMSKSDAFGRIGSLLSQVGLPPDTASRLPQAFSGGQRQRIAIARALAVRPGLIICDEPVSGLDLATQATVLDLLVHLQDTLGVAYLFITHDLSVVRYISHRVSVMRGGELVESGDCRTVTENPRHPYTQRLLAASPVPDPDRQQRRRALFESLPAS
ncbi:ATP-binding cassette domain-containing protein [Tomitella gaofuii]|uniref:ATP-binding cassette domain-containing protein n=1 Tax=Tomitella gaofuii TaxID=2760083 RepID=UPI002E2DD999|nr:ATP-binding cassette domain-containing protein [Tomitella gaofuii]